MKPEAAHELKEPEEYTEDELRKESYFRHLEDDESFEWFFHRDDSKNPELNDYQRIVLRNFVSLSTLEPSGLVSLIILIIGVQKPFQHTL